MKKAYRKTDLVKVIQYTGDNLSDLRSLCGSNLMESGGLTVMTMDGLRSVSLNGFIVKPQSGGGCSLL